MTLHEKLTMGSWESLLDFGHSGPQSSVLVPELKLDVLRRGCVVQCTALT